jgi:hypothetical protein
MSIHVDCYADIPCENCKKLHKGKTPPRESTEEGTIVAHLMQIGDTVVVGPKSYDIDQYFQCPKCGEIWHSHQDFDPGGKSWSIDPIAGQTRQW